MNQTLYVVQIANAPPHQVKVARRAVPEEVAYDTCEGIVRSLIREDHTLCNWHLFPQSPADEGDNEETFKARAFAI